MQPIRKLSLITKPIRLCLAVLFAMGGLGTAPAWASAGLPKGAEPATRQPAVSLQPFNTIIPTVTFSAARYRGFETDGDIPITVTLSAAAVQTATVDYATSPGSALAGTDYTAVNGTLTFSPGITSQSFNVPLLDNPLGQADQTLTATLSNPVSATLGAPNTALVVIGDSETTAFTVTKSADTAEGACELTNCSLRDAVIAANAYPGANTINLPAGTYTLSLAGSNEDAALTGDLEVTGDLTLSGVTSATTVITTTGTAFGDRVFEIAPSVTMTASDVTVTGGFLPPGYNYGGGFYNQGTLSLIDSTVFSNTAGFGGGIGNDGFLYLTHTQVISNAAYSGGGIFNNLAPARANIQDSNISKNYAANTGSGISSSGILTVTSSLLFQNTGSPGGGGGIASDGSLLNLISTTISTNSGGGMWIVSGTVTISDSHFSSNTGVEGGAIYGFMWEGPITFDIADSTFDRNNAFNGAGIYSEAALTVTDSTFSNNYATGVGGAIYSLNKGATIRQSTFVSNTALSGGGAISGDIAPIAIIDSTAASNTALEGGAIWVQGVLTLTNSTLVSNTATSQGGALYVYAATPARVDNSHLVGNAANLGGGIFASGPLTLTNSTLVSNTAASQGGALYVYTGTTAIVDNSQLISNTSNANFRSSGIYNAGTLTVTNSSILDTIGQGLYNAQGHVMLASSVLSNSSGSGLANLYGSAVITGSTIADNPAGGITNQGSIDTSGTSNASMAVINSLFLHNSNPSIQVGGGAISNIGASLAITSSTFVSNSAASGGGGLFSHVGTGTTIWHSTFSDNMNGAIYNSGGGSPTTTLTIGDSLFSNNHSPTAGAAIYDQGDQLNIISTTFASNTSTSVTFGGGAIYNLSWALRITDSALYSNTSASSAGAVLNAGDSMSIQNSTFSGNQASDSAGGIWHASGPATLNNVTISGNTATHGHTGVGGGGLVVSPGAVLTAANTILAGNTDLGGLAPDCAGTITTGGHNLIQSTAGCTLSGTATGDITGTAALLGPLQYNGGPTWTQALLPGSPAVDAGSPATPGSGGGACEAADQRGIARPQGFACDIGAYEAVGLSVTATVQFAGGVYSAGQTAGSVPITVTLSRVMPVTVTVHYNTTDGTALSGQDYVAGSGTITFTPGVTQATFSVALLADGPSETNETFSAGLNTPVHATLGSPNIATVTIVDNEPPPSIAFSSSQFTVTESAGAAVITVTLSAPSELTATVHYATGDGTARAGGDYLASSGTLTFTPGTTLATLTVPIVQDNRHDMDESLVVALSGPAGAALTAPLTATVTIENNVPAPAVSFSSQAYTVTESGGVAVITATLSAASGLTATVHYATSDGTATAGSDYTPISGTLTFAPGQVRQVITVPITDDTPLDGPETVLLSLSSPAEASLMSPSSATLTIVDEEGEFKYYFPVFDK